MTRLRRMTPLRPKPPAGIPAHRNTAAEKKRAAARRDDEIEARRVAAARAWALARTPEAARVLAGELVDLTHGGRPESTLPWARLRILVHERDGGRCVRCGRVVALSWEMECHHRHLSGQGGPNRLGNLICLCFDCHDWVHGHPVAARLAGGWIMPSTEHYWEVPVLNKTRGWERLADDGSVFPVAAA